jgi:hypothetical protein
LYILAVGGAIALLAMIFITSSALAWIILIGWGLVRNSPYPVLYAAVMDTVPDAASSGLGLMIGLGLGASAWGPRASLRPRCRGTWSTILGSPYTTSCWRGYAC